MADFARALGASKSASTLLVLFIPSKDRTEENVDQAYWVSEALTVLGTLFGGATAFPQGRGVWRDDAQDGKLLFDEPVVIQCYTGEQTLEREASGLRDFLHRMGREARQGAVGFVIDRDYLENRLPAQGALPVPAQAQETEVSNHGKEHSPDCRPPRRQSRHSPAGCRRRRVWCCPSRRDRRDPAPPARAWPGPARRSAD